MSLKMSKRTRRDFLKITGAASVALTLGASRIGASPDRADLVLLNGKIITVDEKDSIAQAIAVKGGKILKVGTNEEVKELIAENTQVIKLEGKCVAPGLVDSHIHVLYFGKQVWEGFTEIRPPKVNSKKALLEALRERASPHP